MKFSITLFVHLDVSIRYEGYLNILIWSQEHWKGYLKEEYWKRIFDPVSCK